jgi:hypothetical protein
MAGLSAIDLGKRNNWALFLRKIADGMPFETVDKKEVIIGHKLKSAHTTLVEHISSLDSTKLNTSVFADRASVVFPTVDGKSISLTKLQKTREFGSTGNTTAKEDKALSQLINAISAEKVKTGLVELPFKFRGKTFNVYDTISTPGTPKSDFHFVNKNGVEVFWMSHKYGKTEKDFQQWGGISDKEKEVNSHKETQNFIEKCVARFGTRIPNTTTVAMEINDPKLKNMSVYGVDYGKAMGRQNVDVCLQGNLSIKKVGEYYTVVADAHTTVNGEVPDSGYEPVFMIIYKGDRSQFGIGGARVTISPRNCRKISEPIWPAHK